MAEALMITVFLGLLIILRIIDQKKIIVFAQSSPVRKSLSILLTVGRHPVDFLAGTSY